MAQLKKFVGDAAIVRGIKALNTRLSNINTDVQALAVAIVEHAAGIGNGDVSRSLDLCKTVARHKTLNVAYLVGWFRYFGNCTVNLRADDGKGKVSLISRDAAFQQKRRTPNTFDVEGARANNWFDAFAADGTRAVWYEGPAPADFQPYTIGDEANRIRTFVEGERKRLDATKTVNGKEVPLVALTDEDRTEMLNALMFMEKLAATLARHEVVRKLAEQQAKLEQDVDPQVAAIIQPQERAVA